MNKKYLPYVGLNYSAGLQDCFSVVQQAYKEVFDIHVRDYARPLGWESFEEFDFFEELYHTENFQSPTNNVRDVREGDLLLMAIASKKINHCALYTGDGNILHHLTGRLSVVEPYNSRWQGRVHKILRHKDREEKMCNGSAQLLELLPQHLQLRVARRMEEENDK